MSRKKAPLCAFLRPTAGHDFFSIHHTTSTIHTSTNPGLSVF